jgi:hypothetical protein
MRKMLGADGGMTLPPPIPMVPKAGLEPARACAHRPLKTACLPIPPLRHPEDYVKTVWTDRQLPPTAFGLQTSKTEYRAPGTDLSIYSWVPRSPEAGPVPTKTTKATADVRS